MQIGSLHSVTHIPWIVRKFLTRLLPGDTQTQVMLSRDHLLRLKQCNTNNSNSLHLPSPPTSPTDNIYFEIYIKLKLHSNFLSICPDLCIFQDSWGSTSWSSVYVSKTF